LSLSHPQEAASLFFVEKLVASWRLLRFKTETRSSEHNKCKIVQSVGNANVYAYWISLELVLKEQH
jgi:hypothetical protein